MTKGHTSTVETLTRLGTRDYIRHLHEDVYPQLYDLLNDISAHLTVSEEYDEYATICSIFDNINMELDELIRKEKYVLFPYLIKLDEDGKKSENSKPFDSIHQHVVNITSAIGHFKSYLHSPADAKSDHVAETLRLVTQFEDMLGSIQEHKERFLFHRYQKKGQA